MAENKDESKITGSGTCDNTCIGNDFSANLGGFNMKVPSNTVKNVKECVKSSIEPALEVGAITAFTAFAGKFAWEMGKKIFHKTAAA